jgi:hypothetical protein
MTLNWIQAFDEFNDGELFSGIGYLWLMRYGSYTGSFWDFPYRGWN